MIDNMQPTSSPSSAPTPTSAPIQSPTTLPPTPAPIPVSTTIPPVSPPPPPPPVMTMPREIPRPPRENGWIWVIVILVIVAALVGGYVLAAKYNLLSFGRTLYTSQTFFSSILAKSSTITSSSYDARFSLNVGPRDKDAKPFNVVVTNLAALREQYQNDSERANAVAQIISSFPSGSTYDPKLRRYVPKPVVYPATLQIAASAIKSGLYPARKLSITDPLTNKEYDYKVVNGGSDFNLTVTFETDNAIKAIRQSYGYVATTTIIKGKTVTFTKKSQTYFYLPTEPPKPFLVQLGESMSMLPADLNISFDAGAQADFSKAMADWLAQFDATGSFGDLTYKVNAEARKKDTNYYVRINNIPSIIGSFDAYKGKWIKISAVPATSTNSGSSYNPLDSFTQELQSAEKTYKNQRQNFIDGLKKIAVIADQSQVIAFKNTPKQETVGGRKLTRYDLQLRKESILPFYQKVVTELNKEPNFKDSYDPIVDQGTIDYLKSDEFNQVFDYIDKNTQFTLWADSQGYPALIQETMRIIPPDTATQLKDKQVNVTMTLALNNINQPVVIQAPDNAVSISDVMNEIQNNQYGYDPSGETKMKAKLSNIRMQAEIVYSTTTNSFGKKPFVIGACKQTVGTLFGDALVFKSIQDATNNSPSKATCISSQDATGKVTSYAVSIPLPSDPTYSWCVDSSGSSKQIKGVIKSSVCK